MSSVENHQDRNGAEAPALWEEAKEFVLVQPPEERASGDLPAACPGALRSGVWRGNETQVCPKAARAGYSQKAGELGTQGGPNAGNALTNGAQPHDCWTQQAEPAASNRVHWQPQRVMNQIQGPSTESSQAQKETEPETGLETRPQHVQSGKDGVPRS